MRHSLALLSALALLVTACTYSYKPKENETPAYIALRGVLIGDAAADPENYSLDVTSMNGAAFSMIPTQLNSDRPKEMPIPPGPSEAGIFMTWPNSLMGKNIGVPFAAEAGEHYHFTLTREGRQLIVTLLDSKNSIVQQGTFTLSLAPIFR